VSDSKLLGSLTVSRKNGESILIGEDILITINAASNGGTKVTIKAPRSIPIMRTELLGVAK
jgi:carbon storage regulator